MQGQQNGTPVNMGLVLEEYKATVTQMTDELILLRAYVRQLEKQLEEATKEKTEQEQ